MTLAEFEGLRTLQGCRVRMALGLARNAIRSMDGSMRYYPGLVKMAGDVHPERMTIPLLFFTQGDANLLEDIGQIS